MDLVIQSIWKNTNMFFGIIYFANKPLYSIAERIRKTNSCTYIRYKRLRQYQQCAFSRFEKWFIIIEFIQEQDKIYSKKKSSLNSLSNTINKNNQ